MRPPVPRRTSVTARFYEPESSPGEGRFKDIFNNSDGFMALKEDPASHGQPVILCFSPLTKPIGKG